LLTYEFQLTMICQILRPISRLGGIMYGRTVEALEIPRPDFDKDLGGVEAFGALEKKERETKGRP
jgi:hypothetical protein